MGCKSSENKHHPLLLKLYGTKEKSQLKNMNRIPVEHWIAWFTILSNTVPYIERTQTMIKLQPLNFGFERSDIEHRTKQVFTKYSIFGFERLSIELQT